MARKKDEQSYASQFETYTAYAATFKEVDEEPVLTETQWQAEKFIDTQFPLEQSPLERQIAGSHYKTMAIQPIEYNQKNKLPYCEAAVVKYVSRHRFKGGKEDILKAIHCLEMLLEMEYKG